MLASMWLEACDCPSAWISLDEADNDLQSFTSYLLAAVQTVFPTTELKTRSLLEAPVLPPAPVLAHSLLNDLDQIAEPFILALDDMHLIREQAVLDFLSDVMRHPSPSMSLVLIGRRDPALPVASLRAHCQVTEIRTWDLRFTPQEAARLLGQVLNCEIDGADAATVTWPEGKKKPKTKHLADMTGAGVVGGAFWGMLFGLIFFIPFFGMAVGAAIGALSGHFANYGIDKEFIEQAKAKVTEGTSAVFLMTSEAVSDKVTDAVKNSGLEFDLFNTNLSKEQEAQLREDFGA